MGEENTTDRATASPSTRRSNRARDSILAAAWELFVEHGLRTMSIEAIAERAGVGKTTIYRWWPSKAAVVLDALHEHLDTDIGFPQTGSVHLDLARQLRSVIRLLNSPPGKTYLALIAESQHDPALAEDIRSRYLVHRRTAATATIARGIDRGELPGDADPGLLIDLMYGAVYYRFLVSHDPTPARYADQVVRTVLGPTPPTPAPTRKERT